MPEEISAHQLIQLSFSFDCIDPMSIVGDCASALYRLRIFRCKRYRSVVKDVRNG